MKHILRFRFNNFFFLYVVVVSFACFNLILALPASKLLEHGNLPKLLTKSLRFFAVILLLLGFFVENVFFFCSFLHVHYYHNSFNVCNFKRLNHNQRYTHIHIAKMCIMMVYNFDFHRFMLTQRVQPLLALVVSSFQYFFFRFAMHTKIELFSYGKLTISLHLFCLSRSPVVFFFYSCAFNAFNLLQWKIRKTRDKRKHWRKIFKIFFLSSAPT